MEDDHFFFPRTSKKHMIIFFSTVQYIGCHHNYHSSHRLFQVVREIEVSHWGRVSIAERYDMLNSGARLTGPYSMLDQKQKRNIQKAAFRDLVVTLPKTAENVYFRDRIGNISSSNFRKTRKFSSLELRPRFTLYGGWKNDFEFGYQVPSDEFVSVNQKDKTFHKLSAPFSIPFPNAVIDNLTVKVILPEGATDIEVSLPFEVDSYTMETLFSYLDTTGRPVVVFNKKNVVDFHRQHFEVVYNFTWLAILREPFFLFTGFFIAFLVFIGLSRVSLELSVPGDEVKDIVLKSQENTVANVESDDGSFDEYRHMIVTDSDALAVAKSIVDSCDRFTSSCEDGVKRGSLSKKAEKSLPKLSEMLRQLSVIESSTKDFCSHLESIAHEMRGMVAKKNRNGLRKLAIDFNAMMNILKSS
uniref:Dolichyl-diphosphooligosaccharide--protein glycosyltransferase subunit 1 n=1 Tax=Hirondellea gigas TaxID=1518452 RepID=A0A6A7FUS7_9CRUS